MATVTGLSRETLARWSSGGCRGPRALDLAGEHGGAGVRVGRAVACSQDFQHPERVQLYGRAGRVESVDLVDNTHLDGGADSMQALLEPAGKDIAEANAWRIVARLRLELVRGRV